MKKILLFFLLIFSIYPSLAVEVKVSEEFVTAPTGNVTYVYVNVTNDQSFEDTYSLTVFPYYMLGITAELEKYSITLAPGETGTLRLSFTVPDCAEEASVSFKITATSSTDNSIKDSTSVIVSTVRKFPVCISSLNLDNYLIDPGEKVKISVTVTNPSDTISSSFTLETSVWKSAELIKKFVDRIDAVKGKGSVTVENTFETGKYDPPGFYTVKVEMKNQLGEVVSSKETSFKIITLNASENMNFLKIEKAVKYGIISQRVEIVVRNDGNVVTLPTEISESVPDFMENFFYPKTEPEEIERKENRVVYKWIVPPLSPGEEYRIIYEVSVWNVVLVFSILIVILVYLFTQIFKVDIKKSYRARKPLTKESEVCVTLEVKNRGRKEIKNVVVVDYVPSIMKVVEKFETLRPMIRKIRGGTQLVWKLGTLSPGDERIISYRVKPIVDILGTIRLPKAYIKYSGKKGEVKKVLSKTLFLR